MDKVNIETDWPSVVIIHGLMESGKSTAASFLMEKGYNRVKFAGPLKNMLRTILRECGVSEHLIEDYVEGGLKKTPIPEMNDPERPDRFVSGLSDDIIWKLVIGLLSDVGLNSKARLRYMQIEHRDLPIEELGGITSVGRIFSTLRNEWSKEMLAGEVITSRRIMQTLGEEWRNLHHQLLWVKIALAKVQAHLQENEKVVIDDNRYIFEFQAFSHLLPYRFVITRGNKHFQPITEDIHPGERPMPVEWFDSHLKNDGTIKSLRRTMSKLLTLDARYRKERSRHSGCLQPAECYA